MQLKARSPRKHNLLRLEVVKNRLLCAKEDANRKPTKRRNINWINATESKIVLFGTSGTGLYLRNPKDRKFKFNSRLGNVKKSHLLFLKRIFYPNLIHLIHC